MPSSLLDDPLPSILFPGVGTTERRRLAELRAAGRIRPVAPRLYVSVSEAQTPQVLRNAWPTIVARLHPDAFIAHRTALEFTPTAEGEVFLTAPTKRKVVYPGLVLRFLPGPAPRADDPPFMAMRCASQARAFLENLSHRTAPTARLAIAQLEARLEQILLLGGEAELNRLRDHAREIAGALGWMPQFARLDRTIGGLLGTRRAPLASSIGRARAAGAPFDAACLARLNLLFGELRSPPAALVDTFRAPEHFTNKAFFEAYFSNYIEGTTFEIVEAENIVFAKQIPANRPQDAHDIVGTFALVADPVEMRRTPRDADELIELLRARHASLMAARPEVAPGDFKTRANCAGNTAFVHPAYVVGTLRAGMELYRDVPPGLARAIFMMFLVLDVHPFVDGNGRIARVMMNAELQAAGQTTIIVPTVYRDDYLQALRMLSRRDRADLLVRVLVRAQRFSHLEFSPYPAVLSELTRRNWFREPDDARIIDG